MIPLASSAVQFAEAPKQPGLVISLHSGALKLLTGGLGEALGSKRLGQHHTQRGADRPTALKQRLEIGARLGINQTASCQLDGAVGEQPTQDRFAVSAEAVVEH